MDSRLIDLIVPELRSALCGRWFGRAVALPGGDHIFDLRLPASRYLFVSINPADPAIFLTERRHRDIERAALHPSPFMLQLKKELSGAEVTAVERINAERAVRIGFDRTDEIDGRQQGFLIVQLTGRSANLFLADEGMKITGRARETNGPGQQIGDEYLAPARPEPQRSEQRNEIEIPAGKPVAEFLDERHRAARAAREFAAMATSARERVTREIRKRERLLRNLDEDLAAHGDAERWKRSGDLLLSNVGTAKRDGPNFLVIDHFDDAAPTVAIEANENDSITQAAEKYFRRYTKARNAAAEIARRREEVESQLGKLRAELELVDNAIASGDQAALSPPESHHAPKPARGRAKQPESSAVRRFISSDGFEVLVGKKAADNDRLTFRMARSLDIWMHAADYPGSHVVIRNQGKKEVPQRTLLEAAQLAAFYSRGNKQPKAAVHYTLRKFVNKPKGAAPGLVSLAQFKTLLVEPRVPQIDRI